MCASKFNNEIMKKSIVDIIEGSKTKKRKFVETVELQIALKDYDPQRDKRFSGTTKLPNHPRPKLKICMFSDQHQAEEAAASGADVILLDQLKSYNKNKKAVKKLAKQYDGFLCSQILITQIPRYLGPGLNKVGKFPVAVNHNEKISDKINDMKASIKFQLKKVLCMGTAIGNVGMTEDQLKANSTMAVTFLASLLKKGWNNVKRLHMKSTMGKPYCIYG